MNKVIIGLSVSNLVLLLCLCFPNFNNWFFGYNLNDFKFGFNFREPFETKVFTFENEYANPFEVYKQYPIDLLNASSVFNSIQGALVQKNSNLNPIGVNFIPAYIPPNTRFYHSTSNPFIPKLFEWIAMDYEFSYYFSRFTSNFKNNFDHGNGSHFPWPGLPFYDDALLYTFRTKKPIDKLIFLDGASAAKATPEMDQQLILSKQKNISAPVREEISSEIICKWGEKFGLQGIVRLEIGYEIILCDFQDTVELISNITLDNAIETISFPEEQIITDEYSKRRKNFLQKLEAQNGFEHLRQGSLTDFGEKRIKLDYSNMVTPLNKTFIDPNPYTRNISYISQDLKDGIINNLENIFQNPVNPFDKTDWQVITNVIEYKFGPVFQLINNTLLEFNGTDESLEKIGNDLTFFTFNFVRRYNDNVRSKEDKFNYGFNSSILDYVYHTYPLQNTDVLIYSSIFKIQYEISSLIYKWFELGNKIIEIFYFEDKSTNDLNNLKDEIIESRDELYKLLNILHWSIFTDCRTKCKTDEFCYSPTWGPSPLGWFKKQEKFFNKENGYLSIQKDLQCLSYQDILNELKDREEHQKQK